jgi:hypothetical protein
MKSGFTATVVVALLAGLWLSAPLRADELMIYPKNAQSADQQEKDKFECYSWAKNESGFDPMAPPMATEAPPQQQAPRGGVVRGAARGAAVGAIIGDSDDAKKGAAAGAAVGGMRRRDQKRKEAQEQQQWEQEQQRIYAEKRDRYNRAYSVCLEAHDYIVK